MEHPDVLRVAMLHCALRPHLTKLGNEVSLTGGDELISAEVNRIGNPIICWEVWLRFETTTVRVEMGAEGQNVSFEHPARVPLRVIQGG